MTGPDRPHPSSVVDAIKNVFDTKPQGEGGLGPTLGQDVSPEAQRRTDARSGAKPAPETGADDSNGVFDAADQNKDR